MDENEGRTRARSAAAQVDGWLSERQGAALFAAAARCSSRGAIVEIGAWKGRSTIWLAYGAELAGQRVWSVDPHVGSREDPEARTFDEFSGNIHRAGVAHLVTPLVMTSLEAAREPIGPIALLFIDGDHSDQGAEQDASLWFPRLIEGGTLMMHDVATAGYTGPRRVFRRRVCWAREFAGIRRVGSMGVATRVRRRSALDAGRGVAAGLALYALDAKRLIRLQP